MQPNSSRMIAKVCGLTHADDVAMARAAGADLFGFVRHAESPRHCENLAAATAGVGEHGVLVCVGDDLDAMIVEARAHGLGWLQPYLRTAQRATARARINAAGLHLLLPWPDQPQPAVEADLFVWETSPTQTGVHGGSGQSHAAAFPPPGAFLLAGGMDARSVATRITSLTPALRSQCGGADAASRLEASPGRKSPTATFSFVEAVHACTL